MDEGVVQRFVKLTMLIFFYKEEERLIFGGYHMLMLGTYIREIRKARNISLSQLSKKTNISKSYLSNIERNIQTNPSIGILTKISDALDADIQELIVASNASSQLNETNE